MNLPPAIKPSDVFYVIGGLDLGGSERHLSRVAQALTRSGMNVSVYSLAGDGPLRGELERNGVEVVVPPIGKIDSGRPLIIRALRLSLAWLHLTLIMIRKPPTIVHFFLPAAYILGGVAAMIARVRIRVMSRRSLNLYQNRLVGTRRIEQRLHRTMSAILGNSNAVIAELREEGVSSDRLALIHNGIVCDDGQNRSRCEIRATLKISDQTLVFIIVANLIPYKGHLDLIEAFGKVKSRIETTWRLLVVGRDDGIGAEIKAAIQRHAIEDRVHMLGARPDVADLLLASDIGLLCSHEEGFSNAILEGMATGLPMIVTDVGGNAEAVLDGQTGIVVPPRDPETLAAAIIRLAQNPDLRARYGSSGRARIEQHFTLDICVAKYVALYRGLIDGRLPSAVAELQEQAV